MHIFGAANDGVNRTGNDAFGTSDTHRRFDSGNQPRSGFTKIGVKVQFGLVQQPRQRSDSILSARRATINWGRAVGDRLRIWQTCRKATASTLGLRQQAINLCGQVLMSDSVRHTPDYRRLSSWENGRQPAPVCNGADNRLFADAIAVLNHEFVHFRQYFLTPATATENSVMAGTARDEMAPVAV